MSVWREEFTKWLEWQRKQAEWTWLPPVDKLARLDDGSYANPIIQLAWKAWFDAHHHLMDDGK